MSEIIRARPWLRSPALWITVLVLGGWALLLVGVRLLGLHIVAARDADLKLGAIPLYGEWDWTFQPWLPGVVVVGVLIVAALPWLARRLPRRAVLGATAMAAVGFSLVLGLAERHPDVWLDIYEAYAVHIGLIGEAGGVEPFLRGYNDSLPTYPVHLQGHPPGIVLFFGWADAIGWSGPGFANTVGMAGVAAMSVAALAIGREVAGESAARAAAPFLVVAPAAVWHTNTDMIFGGVALSAVACLVLATGRSGLRAGCWAVAGGLLAGAALMLSFGVALLAIPVVVIAVWRRRWTVLALGGAVAAGVMLLPLMWGYWWLEGIGATRERYYDGVAVDRGYWYFLLANLAVFALALGPAIAVALARLRDRRMWVVVASGLAVVAVADLSGMSSGETERIWQPFMPLVLLAGCALPRARMWLILQLAVTVALAAALRVQW